MNKLIQAILNSINIFDFYRRWLQNPKTRWITVVLSMIYIISPIDFIPEVLFPLIGPLGLLDDGAIFLVMISELYKIYFDKKN
jgi:uncharacterized membrane protein YkvA (DUF1232 family)